MRYPTWFLASAAVAIIFGGLLVATQNDQSLAPDHTRHATQTTGAAARCRDAYVIDGDTISCTISGQSRTRVRIVGINTPEVARDGQAGECYADRATTQLRRLLNGRVVTVSRDPATNDTDRYGRLLRVVATPTTANVGLEMVRDGHAHAYDQSRPTYTKAQNHAKGQKAGLWGACTS